VKEGKFFQQKPYKAPKRNTTETEQFAWSDCGMNEKRNPAGKTVYIGGFLIRIS
jgi:hypothetical protein